jgi:hypothetical protein
MNNYYIDSISYNKIYESKTNILKKYGAIMCSKLKKYIKLSSNFDLS